MKQCLETDNQAAALVLQGDDLLKKGQAIAATDCFIKAINLYEKNAEENKEEIKQAYSCLAAANIEQGRLLLSSDLPSSDMAIVNISTGIYYYQRDVEKNQEKIKAAYSLLAAAFFEQGLILLRTGRTNVMTQAIAYFTKSINYYKKDAAMHAKKIEEVYYHRAKAYRVDQRTSKDDDVSQLNNATEDLSKAKSYPGAAHFYIEIADIYRKCRELMKAKICLGEAVALLKAKSCPSTVQFYVEIADMYRKCHDRTGEEQCLEEAIALPDDAYTLDAYTKLIESASAQKWPEYLDAIFNRFYKSRFKWRQATVLKFYCDTIASHPKRSNSSTRDQDYYLFILKFTALILLRRVVTVSDLTYKYGRSSRDYKHKVFPRGYFYELATGLMWHDEIAETKFVDYSASLIISMLEGLVTIANTFSGTDELVTKLEQLKLKEEARKSAEFKQKETNRILNVYTKDPLHDIGYYISLQRR
jgi:tetratricopeptide (TPR) repeat protein